MTKQQNEIYNWLLQKPGYLKKSALYLQKNNFKTIKLEDIFEPLNEARYDYYLVNADLEEEQVVESKYTQVKTTDKSKKLKRLYFDLEVSPNIVSTWRVGYNLNITPDNIIKERAIICACYKWEGDSKVHYLAWDKGCDNKLVHDLYKVIIEANEVVGHNGDRFDIKWFNTRCLFHGIKEMPEIRSIDTLKLAKKHFLFNSNKLDYIGQFLSLGKKIHTDYGLWKRVCNYEKKALNEMVTYCKQDVNLLEKVHLYMEGYSKAKTHVGVLIHGDKCSCPKCGSLNIIKCGTATLATGVIRQYIQCKDCNKYSSMSLITSEKLK